MSEEKQNIQMTIDIENLDESMLITAYVGFDSRYDAIDEKLCKWIQHNFKGSSAIVKRDREKMKFLVDEIKPGDNLCKIHKLPPSFVDITQVSQKLKNELKSRGFNRFDVQKASIPDLEGQENLQQAIQQVNSFVQKVKKSIKVCENATKAVENLLDNSRQGNMNIDDMKTCVSNIKNNESAEAVSAIISMKANDQVYAHCVDVGVVFQSAYYGILKLRGEKSIFKDEEEALLAAFLHDIGKARIPKDLLGSRAVFKKDSEEMKIIRAHPQAGAEMLIEMGMPDYIINMANYHHVKLDKTMGSSYPKDIEDKNILFETRLLALVDAYQALCAGRSYKKSWTPPAVMRYLDATAGIEFDLQLWQDFQKVMGHYPIGSFVKLSDGSHGFVMNVPQKNVLKPQIAIVRNSEGEDLEQQYLIDLQKEQDLSITKEIDPKLFYKDNVLEKFTNVNVS